MCCLFRHPSGDTIWGHFLCWAYYGKIQHFPSAKPRAPVLIGSSFFIFIPLESFDYDFKLTGCRVRGKQYYEFNLCFLHKRVFGHCCGDLEKVELSVALHFYEAEIVSRLHKRWGTRHVSIANSKGILPTRDYSGSLFHGPASRPLACVHFIILVLRFAFCPCGLRALRKSTFL